MSAPKMPLTKMGLARVSFSPDDHDFSHRRRVKAYNTSLGTNKARDEATCKRQKRSPADSRWQYVGMGAEAAEIIAHATRCGYHTPDQTVDCIYMGAKFPFLLEYCLLHTPFDASSIFIRDASDPLTGDLVWSLPFMALAGFSSQNFMHNGRL